MDFTTKNWSTLEFKHRDQKITLIKKNGVYETTLLVRKDPNWQINGIVPLLRVEKGKILHASKIVSINYSSEEEWTIELADDSTKDFFITSTIERNNEFGDWIHFTTTVFFRNERHFSKFGPEIIIKLVPEADFSKNGTLIKQPTRHTPSTEEWKSNDMPAATFWNPQSKLQTYFFVDFTEMDWMAPD
ncbi:MAG: hypothetical protein ACFFDT_19325, partial [Candidatus Hodarchaeota archaeon]